MKNTIKNTLYNLGGLPFTLKVKTGQVYNSSTGSYDNKYTEYTGKCSVEHTELLQPGTYVEGAEVKILLPADVEPHTGDKINVENTEYTLNKVSPVYFKGEVVMWIGWGSK